MKCGMRNAMDMRIGNEGIAFLRFLWALVINLSQDLVVDAKTAAPGASS